MKLVLLLFLLLVAFLAFARADESLYERESTVPILPFCRKGHLMAKLQLDGEEAIVLFGGKGKDYILKDHGQITLNDLWTLRLEEEGDGRLSFFWDMQQPNYEGLPPERRWKAAADKYENMFYVFGGDAFNEHVMFDNDFWKYNLHSNTWSNLSSINTPPSRRGHSFAIFDDGSMVVSGGKHKQYKEQNEHLSPCIRDTYVASLNTQPITWSKAQNFTGTCRWGSTAVRVIDEDGEESMATFGGRILTDDTVPIKEGYTYFNDIYYFKPATGRWVKSAWNRNWTSTSTYGPSPRDHQAAVYVDELETMFIYGGRNSPDRDPALADLWGFHFPSGTWKEYGKKSPTKPPSRYMMAMESWNDNGRLAVPKLVMFGGEHFYDEPKSNGKDNAKLNDLWVFDLDQNEWIEVSSGGCKEGDEGLVLTPLITPSSLGLFLVLFLLLLMNIVCVRYQWRLHRQEQRELRKSEKNSKSPFLGPYGSINSSNNRNTITEEEEEGGKKKKSSLRRKLSASLSSSTTASSPRYHPLKQNESQEEEEEEESQRGLYLNDSSD